MSKKNRHRHQNHQPQISAPLASGPGNGSPVNAGTRPSVSEMPQRITEIHSASLDVMSDEDAANPPSAPPPPPSSGQNLEFLWKVAHEAQELFRRAKLRAEEAEAKAVRREGDAKVVQESQNKRQAELDKQRDEQRDVQRTLEEQKRKCESKDRELAELEAQIKERELAAEAGFIAQRRQALVKLEDEANALGEQIVKHHQDYAEQLKAYEIQLRSIRERELAGLQEEREKSDKEKLQIETVKRESLWMQEELQEQKASWSRRLDEAVREAVSDRQKRLDSALQRCEELGKQIAQFEEAERRAGGKTKGELLVEIAASRTECEKLRAQLAEKPADDQVAHLRSLESTNEQLRSQIGQLRQENQSLSVQLGKLQIGVSDLQNLRDQKMAWETREKTLRACIEDLQRELGQLVEKSKAQKVFPSLMEMDEDKSLQAPPDRTRDTIPSLREFADEVRRRIAHQGLYYQEADIRAFLAGLASSRLHLLQGISGTGKTSLPRAFAKAVGGEYALIEVQSGWRDKNDLLGYYNAFERRYYESNLLKALYRAQTRRCEEVPFFVILDEMNLSHPEHYFADFLSALQSAEGEQEITLLTARVEPAPARLIEGLRLAIPRNVWFVGTANHDETTKDFADKTYDRAHIMEFPRHPQAFAPGPLRNLPPLNVKALTDAFTIAIKKHGKEIQKAKGFLDNQLADPLAKVGLGWGNRLEAQSEAFVPVVMEAGGTLGEALDHLLATKLLRKLRGRFDLGVGQLKELTKEIENVWLHEAIPGGPEKSVGLLEREVKRLGGPSA